MSTAIDSTPRDACAVDAIVVPHSPHSLQSLPAEAALTTPAATMAGAFTGSPVTPARSPTIVHTATTVLDLVRADFPLWRDSPMLRALDADRFHVRRLTGGSSNSLWIVTLHSPTPKLEAETPAILVVRFYGRSTDAFVKREQEIAVADLLSASGVGARIYHHFEAHQAGRIEQFLPGRSLVHQEFAHAPIGEAIAREMAQLHVTAVPTEGEFANIPRGPQLFVNAIKWFKLAIHAREHLTASPDGAKNTHPEDIFSLANQNRLYSLLGMPVLDESWTLERVWALDFTKVETLPKEISENRWFQEIRWLQRLLDNWQDTSVASPENAERVKNTIALSKIGLCHNDVNPGNILYDEARSAELRPSAIGETIHDQSSRHHSPLTLIDFEYAAFNPPSYDLANHFCEYTLDYTGPHFPFFVFKHREHMPPQEQMMNVLRAYLDQKHRSMPNGPSVTTAALSHLYVSTLTSMLASHLLWSFWSVIQSSTSVYSTSSRPSWGPQPPAFDGTSAPFRPPALGYLEYAEQRLEMYARMKEIWLRGYANPTGTTAANADEPPRWQQLKSDEEWQQWTTRLARMHDEMRDIELVSAQRQEQAYAQYQQAAAANGASQSS